MKVVFVVCFSFLVAQALHQDNPAQFLAAHAVLRRRLVTNGNTNLLHPQARDVLPEHIKNQIDEFVGAIRECGRFPGITVSVTSRNTTLHTSAAGVTNANNPTRLVDNSTLFSIGSTTKAFTTTAIAMLEDRGLASWDDHDFLRSKMPFFHLNDSYADMDVTLRDLASHRTGLSAEDLMWVSQPNTTRMQAVETAVPLILPALKFRYEFLYNNWMFATLGSFIDAATSWTWESFVQTQILDKLGMTRTQLSVPDAVQAGNYASPHLFHDNATQALPDSMNDCLSIVGPAGSIAASSLDVAKWLRLHLNAGYSPDAQQTLVSAQALAKTYAPVSVISADLDSEVGTGYLPNAFGVADITLDYGLGWMVSSYRGLRELWHGGGTLGHITQVAFLPDSGVGMFVSINQIGGAEIAGVELAKIFVYDLVLGVENPALNATQACKILEEQLPTKQTTRPLRARVQPNLRSRKGSFPLLPSNAVGGVFAHPAWGKLTIAESGAATLNNMTTVLQPNGTAGWFSVHGTGVWELIASPIVANISFVPSGGLRWICFDDHNEYFFSQLD